MFLLHVNSGVRQGFSLELLHIFINDIPLGNSECSTYVSIYSGLHIHVCASVSVQVHFCSRVNIPGHTRTLH